MKNVTLTGGEDHYGDTVVFPQVLDIAGADARAKVMLVPAGRSARRQHGGPMVPGPWADLILQATVISDPPQPYEQSIALEPGDRVTVEGTTFAVSISDGIGGKGGGRGWVRRGYPLLDPVEVPA